MDYISECDAYSHGTVLDMDALFCATSDGCFVSPNTRMTRYPNGIRANDMALMDLAYQVIHRDRDRPFDIRRLDRLARFAFAGRSNPAKSPDGDAEAMRAAFKALIEADRQVAKLDAAHKVILHPTDPDDLPRVVTMEAAMERLDQGDPLADLVPAAVTDAIGARLQKASQKRRDALDTFKGLLRDRAQAIADRSPDAYKAIARRYDT